VVSTLNGREELLADAVVGLWSQLPQQRIVLDEGR
jgi:hypothetical protein